MVSDQLLGYHDELDFVSVHEALLEDMQTALVGTRGRHSLDNQIDTIVKAKAIGLAEKKGMLHVRYFMNLRHNMD